MRSVFLILLFFLFVLVVEIESQLYDLPEIVLDVDVDGLLVGRSGGVVETEHLAFERIAVVGQEYRAVVHAERSFAVGLEVADRVPRPSRFSSHRISAVSPFTIFVCTGIVSTVNGYAC